jgi:hypothetical protein
MPDESTRWRSTGGQNLSRKYFQVNDNRGTILPKLTYYEWGLVFDTLGDDVLWCNLTHRMNSIFTPEVNLVNRRSEFESEILPDE